LPPAPPIDLKTGGKKESQEYPSGKKTPPQLDEISATKNHMLALSDIKLQL